MKKFCLLSLLLVFIASQVFAFNLAPAENKQIPEKEYTATIGGALDNQNLKDEDVKAQKWYKWHNCPTDYGSCTVGVVGDWAPNDRFGVVFHPEVSENFFFCLELRVLAMQHPSYPPGSAEMFLLFWQDDCTQLPVGVPLWDAALVLQAANNAYTSIDLSNYSLYGNNSCVRFAFEYDNGGSWCYFTSGCPKPCRDTNGINYNKNLIYAPPSWYWSESLGVSGDWVMHLRVDARVPVQVFSFSAESNQ